jgi:hypothetical protein
MYDTKFECRYHKDDVFLETDQVIEQEKIFIRNVLYKEDLLNIFFIDYNDDIDVFENVINELFEKISNCEELISLMKEKAESVLFSNEIKDGLTILYSYDYMYATHKCVSEYLETGSLSQENIDLLNKICK